MKLIIRVEESRDIPAIREVNRKAFASDAEPRLVDAIRDGGHGLVSLVAESDGEIVGHILFSGLSIVTRFARIDAVSLAPMAVLPDCQRQSIGTRLVHAGLAACREQGHRIVLVLGHPEFYSRFGFSAKLAQPLESPFGGGEAWMAKELAAGAMDGIEGRVEFSSPFSALE